MRRLTFCRLFWPVGSTATGAFLTGMALIFPHAKAHGYDGSETVEEIYVLRSIREPRDPVAGWCASSRTGFAPLAKDAERMFSFWSVEVQPDGKVAQAKRRQVAELHACLGQTNEPARQNFYAEIKLGSISFRGRGECLALKVNFPETGLFPVRCQLDLSGLPAEYVGGMLTTNTLASRSVFGGDTDPPGYTQASIATIRLWKSK